MKKMKYLYEHKCDYDKCDFSFKYLHDRPIMCGVPFNSPEALRKHREDNPKHLWFSMKKIDTIE